MCPHFIKVTVNRPSALGKVSPEVRLESLDTSPRQQIQSLLERFGIPAEPGSVYASGRGIRFRFREPGRAERILSDRRLFSRGPLGILHARQVGGLRTEYRSYKTSADYSLHIVLGRKDEAFADLDHFNPYQSPLQLLLHGVLELCPYLLRHASQALRHFGNVLGRWWRLDA